jgi:solute:Na+ symporter, SSS family
MVSGAVGLTVTVVALVAFAVVGIRGAGRFRSEDRDRYLTARGTQRGGPLALSFLASALGTWVVIAPPIVGSFAGLLGILGYAVGQALAIGIFAWLGPAVRGRIPAGTTILEWVGRRFGRGPQVYVGGISVLYMFLFLVVELTSIGLILTLIAGVDPLVPILAVAVATTAYTAYGGLPASLATDRWQGLLILGLVAAAGAAILAEVPDLGGALSAGGATSVTRTGAEAFGVLVVAVVAANLFHQGLWQRVWAAADDRAIARGAAGGALLILPLVLAVGAAGALAAGAGLAPEGGLPFFGLLAGLPQLALVGVVALGVALVASTTDTLQNALASVVARDVGGGRMSLAAARLVTVALMVPAAAIAARGVDVLRVFLVADLFAATIAVPVFLGLWRRVTPAAMVTGAAAGLLAVVAVGWVDGAGPLDGLLLLTLPEGLYAGPALGAFVAAPVASGAVALGVSLLSARRRAGARSPAG